MIVETYLSVSPRDEGCAQFGNDDYAEAAGREINALIRQLERHFGSPPPGFEFRIGATERELGYDEDYRTEAMFELLMVFDDENKKHVAYARRVDAGFPDRWDDIARQELGLTDDEDEDAAR
jgi:hypothetical protein